MDLALRYPGDTWQDYIPVFIANGFYRNKTDFIDQHVIYDWRSKYPKVDRYLNTGRLIRLRNRILVTMEFERHHIASSGCACFLQHSALQRYFSKPLEPLGRPSY